jgi:hypothetical protein
MASLQFFAGNALLRPRLLPQADKRVLGNRRRFKDFSSHTQC